MSAHVLISGSLFRAPEEKTSKNGAPYVVATVKTRDGDASQFWRITAFAETARAELMRLREGDAIATQGALQASIWSPEGGEPRLNLSLVADHVLALRQPPRQRKPKAAARGRGGDGGDDGEDFGDDMPF